MGHLGGAWSIRLATNKTLMLQSSPVTKGVHRMLIALWAWVVYLRTWILKGCGIQLSYGRKPQEIRYLRLKQKYGGGLIRNERSMSQSIAAEQ